MDANDTCAIIIEICKDDPFYAAKKNLLKCRGFNTKECIQFRQSECPESISRTLERMIQIARIINLVEEDLYFSDTNPRASAECYSFKNEVAALSSTLQLVKDSLSPKENMKMVLQDLQNAILQKFQEFGVCNAQTKLDGNYNCCMEKGLVQWGLSNGMKTRLEIACFEGAGRGAIAMDDLEVGDVALEIPVSIIISDEVVHEVDMCNVLEKINGISAETMLLLWSMKEKHNSNSKFRMYFDTLPENFNTGLSFGVDAIMALDGTLLLEEIIRAKEHLRTQYEHLIPELCKIHADVFPPELYTWEQFLWACELWYSNSMKLMFPDGTLRTCLIPVAGFLNHSVCPHIHKYGRVDSVTNSLKFPLSRPCSKGEQCFLSYGNLSSSHLVTFYGFLPEEENPYDVIPLDFEIDQAHFFEDCLMPNWTNHMVRGTWLARNHEIFHYGLPTPLLDYLRRSRDHMLHNETCFEAKLKIEMEVLEDLHFTFSNMMENLGDPDITDVRENVSWDVKLASEFIVLQKKILSSILNSCTAGLELVKTELLTKCTATSDQVQLLNTVPKTLEE